jgi:hypothetical protein
MSARFNWIFHFGQLPRYAQDIKIQLDNAPEEIGHNKATWQSLSHFLCEQTTKQQLHGAGNLPICRRGTETRNCQTLLR